MADNTNYIGVAMGLDVTDLKAGLSEANKQIQLANSEFKAASSGMENWSKTTEGLNAKIKQLDTVLGLQQKKLSGLQTEYDKVAKEQGENSEAARNLQVQLNNQKAVVNQTERELNNYKETLKQAEDGTIDLEQVSLKAGKVVKNFGENNKEAATAADLLRQKVKEQEERLSSLKEDYLNVTLEQGKYSKSAKSLKGDIDKLNSELSENKKKLGEVEEAAEDAGDGFTVAKGAIAGFISNGLTALAGATKDAILNVFGLAESTREYRTELAKIETIAKDAGESTDYIKDKWHDLSAVLGDEGAVGEGLNNLLTAGFSGDKLDEVTKLLEGASIKWKDTLKFEGLSDSIQEIIGSQGLSISGSAVELFERMGVDIEKWQEKFSKLGTEEERQNMILQTLADGGLADVSDAYREQNADLINANKENSKYADNMATIGGKIEPITTKIREGFNGILEKVIELAGGADFGKIGASIESGFKEFTDNVLPKIVDGFKWIIDNKDGLIAGIAGIGAAMLTMNVANMIMGVVKAFKAFKTAQEGATVAQWLLNVAMNANPIGLFVAAIAGLVTAFVLLWKNCEGFRNFFIKMWDGIKNIVGVVVDWIKENWQTMLLFLVNPLAGIFKYCYEHFEGFRVFVDNIVSAVKQFFVNLWDGLKSGAKAAVDWLVSVFTPVSEFFSGIFSAIWNFLEPFIHNAKVLITGTWEIIKAVFAIVASWFNENVVQPVAKFFKGLWDGITTAAKNTWTAISSTFKAVASWFNNTVIQPVITTFTGLWNTLKTGASNAWAGIKSVFSSVAKFFGDIFSKAWKKVKDIFSTGGKIFDGIKDGIVSAFKNIVNAIIRGINKVVAVPFNAINKVLGKIKNIEIAGLTPFSGLISDISVPKIPELYRGGVLKKGQKAFLEGKGAEAIVPLEKNLGWIRNIAAQLAKYLALDVAGVKNGLSAMAYRRGTSGERTGSGTRNGGNTIVDARQNVYFNGKLSRKQLKRTENDHYTTIKMKLKAEGAI